MKEVQDDSLVISDIKQLINHSREQVAITVNAETTLLYWLGQKTAVAVSASPRFSRMSRLSTHCVDN